jgi:hypothetical protein
MIVNLLQTKLLQHNRFLINCGMLSKLLYLTFLWVLTLPQASWGEADKAMKKGFIEQEVITKEMHPAGPTIQTEWRKTPTQTPYRIQYEGIKSGHVLVGKARLIRNANGYWYAELSSKIKVAGQVWNIEVTHQETPVEQSGIATESEPSLNLLLFRR